MNDQIADIIAKKLQGTASQEELAQWQTWMDASSLNRIQYEHFVRIWQESGPILTGPTVDTDAAWSKLDRTIQSRYESTLPPIIPLYLKRLSIAIAIFVAFVAAWYFWHEGGQSWETFTAANSNQSIELSDGSVILLRKGSTLKYPHSFKAHERSVQLTGEAFFQVKHDEQKPFLINTSNSMVKVLGTSFLVHSGKTTDEVVVQEGRVSVQANRTGQKAVELIAGERLVLSEGEARQSTVNDSNYIAWKTGLLDFKGTPLKQVLEDIEHYYDIPVQLELSDSIDLEKLHVTARFENQPAEQVLDEIRLTTGLETRKQGDTIIFYKK